MKKLFKVVILGKDHFFGGKVAAKTFRDRQQMEKDVPHVQLHVRRGPDHWKGETF